MISPNKISETLLLAIKTNKEISNYISELENYDFEKLSNHLIDDNHKKAFWINCYNSFFQILRKAKKSGMASRKPEIYKEKHILIAGEKLSLDDIEHGILRRFRYKYSLGYLPNIFAPNFIKNWAVSTLDYRIHFALNCGAKSCPPIAFYSPDRIEQQLNLATASFLETETSVIDNEVHITRLFKWYLNDFGGKTGIRKILNEKLKRNFDEYKLVFSEYSWEEALDNYDENNFEE